MYQFRLVALSLLLCASSAAARDRASHKPIMSAATSPDLARPRAPSVDRYGGPSLSSARLPVVTNIDLGVGIYSVGGHFAHERETNGREPILGTSGRDNRIAAVGFSLRF
jgi:hypothetical protein